MRAYRNGVEYHSHTDAGEGIDEHILSIPFRWPRAYCGADDTRHIRDLIEQVLFTSPGERVNRPTFGSGLLQLVFAPNSDILTSAVQLTVQGALQQWLGDLILVEDVQVTGEDSTVSVKVRYKVRSSQQSMVDEFKRVM